MGRLPTLLLVNSCSSSFIVGDRSPFPKESLFGRSPLEPAAFRHLSISSHSRKACVWRAILDEQRFPFALHRNNRNGSKEELSIFDRLALAWRILFPIRTRVPSNADVAKQRLKMILISDRCSVNDNAKRRIVNNIVGAIADFVEIEPQHLVQLNVSTDPGLGTVYSVSVPIRRVKPEFQENDGDLKDATLHSGLSNPEDMNFDLPEPQDDQEQKSPKSEDVEECNSPEIREEEG